MAGGGWLIGCHHGDHAIAQKIERRPFSARAVLTRQASGADLHECAPPEHVTQAIGRQLHRLSPLRVGDHQPEATHLEPLQQLAHPQWPAGIRQRGHEPPAGLPGGGARQQVRGEVKDAIDRHHRAGEDREREVGLSKGGREGVARGIGGRESCRWVVSGQRRADRRRHPARKQLARRIEGRLHVRRGRMDAGEDMGVQVEHGGGH